MKVLRVTEIEMVEEMTLVSTACFFKQKVYKDTQWRKDITTNINTVLVDILAPTVMKMNYISFNSYTPAKC